MCKHNIDVVAGGLPTTVSVKLNLRKKKGGGELKEQEHKPADNGADTTRLHDVQMVHDRGMDGLNLVARDSGRELAQHIGKSLGARTSA
jgi:hypothetical protein